MDQITTHRTKEVSPFVTIIAYQAIKAFNQTGRTSQVIWEGPRPPLPHKEKGWELSEVTDESTLPIEIQRRINILRYRNIPIKEVLIAHELPPEPKELPAPKETPRLAPPKAPKTVEKPKKVSHIDWRPVERLVKVLAVLVIASMVIVALPFLLMALASVLLPLLTPVLIIAGLVMFGCGADPICIVVLDDKDEYGNPVESWLMCGMWYE